MNKDVADLVRTLRKAGAHVETSPGGHLRVRHPAARRLVFLASTPSGHRWRANRLAELRAAGVPLPG